MIIYYNTKIFVKVKTRTKKIGVEKIDDENFIVSVNEPPFEGRANEAVIEQLAEYFKVAKSRFQIVSGWHSKRKIIEII